MTDSSEILLCCSPQRFTCRELHTIRGNRADWINCRKGCRCCNAFSSMYWDGAPHKIEVCRLQHLPRCVTKDQQLEQDTKAISPERSGHCVPRPGGCAVSGLSDGLCWRST